LAKPALDAVRSGKIRFVPQKWENTYYNWLENIQPWCISRQLWWGHQIPAWYGPDGHVFVGMDEADVQSQAQNYYKKPVTLTRDEDVLDTWFSSALWPFSTLGWENGNDTRADWNVLKRYYPTDVLVTGFDIIFFWVARMIMMGMHFIKDVPFREVYIHALVRDASGQKMSKTKGNVIDPLTVSDEYGCDALRFALAALSVPGRDIKMSTDRIAGYRSFATKLWNAARYSEMNGCALPPGFDPYACKQVINRWVVGEVAKLEKNFSAAINEYRFDEAANVIYHTAWGSFCDWYLEFTKPILAGQNADAIAETRACTAWALAQILGMLNPIMPFITEEICESLNLNGGKPLITSPWPKYNDGAIDRAAVDEINWLIDVITAVRNVRAELNIAAKAELTLWLRDLSPSMQQKLEQNRDILMRMAKLREVSVLTAEIPKGAVVAVISGATIVMPVADVIDISTERARLQKEVGKLDDEIAKYDAKLSNQKFIENAAEEAIEEVREKRADANAARDKLKQALERIAS
jgi:valyl-tRNA synthetase